MKPIQRLFSELTVTPDELHEIGVMKVGRNGIYDACKAYLKAPASGEGIECFRINRRIIIPTAPLRRKLGLEVAAA
jgi:hypothetical protein